MRYIIMLACLFGCIPRYVYLTRINNLQCVHHPGKLTYKTHQVAFERSVCNTLKYSQ